MIDGASKQHRNGAWRLLEPAYSPFPSPICPVLRPTSCSDSGISPLAGRIHAPFWLLWLQLPGPGSGPCAGRVGQPRRRAGGRRGGRMRDRVSVRDRHIPQPRRVCMRMSAGCHDGPWGGSARSRSAQMVVLERPETLRASEGMLRPVIVVAAVRIHGPKIFRDCTRSHDLCGGLMQF